MLEHPVITNMERWGTPDGSPEPVFECPICGAQDIETIYFDVKMHMVMGCDVCVATMSPEDAREKKLI